MPIFTTKFEFYKVLLAPKTDFHFFIKNTKKKKKSEVMKGVYPYLNNEIMVSEMVLQRSINPHGWCSIPPLGL